MPNTGKRVIFPMHLLVMATVSTEAEQRRLKLELDEPGLLELGRRLKASLTKHFNLTCEFNLGLVPKLIRADSIALSPNNYAARLAEQMSRETEQPLFVLSREAAEDIQGPLELRPADLDSFPAITFLTLPFVLCFTVDDFNASGLADDKAAYHDWRPNLALVLGKEGGTLTPLGVTAYHKLFTALDFIHKNMLMDKVAERMAQKATLFLSMDGAELLISKGSLFLPFYTFDDYAEARPEVSDENLGKAYLHWLDRFRLLMYSLEQRKLKFKTISSVADFKTLDLASMEKVTQAATPLPDVIENTVVGAGWERVRDMVLDVFQDETRFVCSVLSGFDKNGALVYQTNFHISQPAGMKGMQDRVRELVEACGLDTAVKTSPIHYHNRKLISPATPLADAKQQAAAALATHLANTHPPKTLH
jgi:hypothetical protein